MFKRLKPTGILVCAGFCVTSTQTVRAAAAVDVRTVATENSTIFLTEIKSAEPDSTCASFQKYKRGSCVTKIHATVLRVFKGADKTTADFETEIHQVFARSGFAPWTDTDIRTGQRYLIFSPVGGELRDLFTSTLGPVLVADHEDAVGDLELILRTESLTVADQAAEVAGAIASSPKPHSYFLADFAARLLALGREVEVSRLRETLEGAKPEAFSASAKVALLGRLWDEAKSALNPPNHLMHAYVVTTATMFVNTTGTADERGLDVRREILNKHVPFLLATEQGRAIVRQAIDLSLAEESRKKATEISGSARLRDDERQHLNLFVLQLRRR